MVCLFTLLSNQSTVAHLLDVFGITSWANTRMTTQVILRLLEDMYIYMAEAIDPAARRIRLKYMAAG